jgi:hypothetical protein
MKINKWKILVILVILLILCIMVYSYKESFVKQKNNYIYSTTEYIERKVDNPSKFITRIDDNTPRNCFNSCINTIDCNSYITDSSNCYLYKNVITPDLAIDNSSNITFIKKIKKNLSYNKNNNINNTPLNTFNDYTYTDCYKKCIDRQNCNSFVTNFSRRNGTGVCKLYNTVNTSTIIQEDGMNTTTLYD